MEVDCALCSAVLMITVAWPTLVDIVSYHSRTHVTFRETSPSIISELILQSHHHVYQQCMQPLRKDLTKRQQSKDCRLL